MPQFEAVCRTHEDITAHGQCPNEAKTELGREPFGLSGMSSRLTTTADKGRTLCDACSSQRCRRPRWPNQQVVGASLHVCVCVCVKDRHATDLQ